MLYKEELNWLTSGQGLEEQGLGQLSLETEALEGTIIPLWNSPLEKEDIKSELTIHPTQVIP